jgi:hypothetical protein
MASDIINILSEGKTPEQKAIINNYFTTLEVSRNAMSGDKTLYVNKLIADSAKFVIDTGHECASMVSGDWSVPNNTYDPADFSGGSLDSTPFDFEAGFTTDYSDGGGISVKGVAGESIYLITLLTEQREIHAANTTSIGAITGTSGSRYAVTYHYNQTGPWSLSGSALFKATSDVEKFWPEIFHTHGSARNFRVRFSVCRVR